MAATITITSPISGTAQDPTGLGSRFIVKGQFLPSVSARPERKGKPRTTAPATMIQCQLFLTSDAQFTNPLADSGTRPLDANGNWWAILELPNPDVNDTYVVRAQSKKGTVVSATTQATFLALDPARFITVLFPDATQNPNLTAPFPVLGTTSAGALAGDIEVDCFTDNNGTSVESSDAGPLVGGWLTSFTDGTTQQNASLVAVLTIDDGNGNGPRDVAAFVCTGLNLN